MITIFIIIWVMLCGVTLYLGVPQIAQAINNYSKELQELIRDQSTHERVVQNEEDTAENVHSIHGEVLDVGDDLYLVREQEGGLVVLHTNRNTRGTETVHRGDHIEAKVSDVNDLTLVLSIRESN